MHPVHKMLVGGVDPLFVWISALVVDTNALMFGDSALINFDIGSLTGINFFELEGVIKEEEGLIT